MFFLGKRPLRKYFQHSVWKVFTASPIDIVVLKFHDLWPTENLRNRVLCTGQKNKTSPASQTVATARITPKICQGQPPDAPDFGYNSAESEIGSISAEL